MRILAAGDFHGDTKAAKRLADLAEREKVDLVILNGDIVEDHNPQGIIGHFVKKKQKVVLIPGNHETLATADFLAELYDVTNLHGYSIKCGDIGIFGCGGANIGLEQLSEEEIFAALRKGYDGVKDMKKKIMVTHVHPSETIFEKFSSFVPGSSGLKKALDTFKPDILICGHVHEAAGIEEKVGKTRIINVGEAGKIIEL